MTLQLINSCVWGAGLTLLLLGAGVLFFVKCAFFRPKVFTSVFSQTLSDVFKSDSKNALKTLSTALSAAMGTGNIVGVCSAIVLGGPGAIFWMWVSALLGMATAYAENYLGAKYTTASASGAMAYLKFGVKSSFLASVFALFGMLASLGMGNMAQSNTLAFSLKSAFGIPEALSGALAAVFVFCVISGGRKRLANACTAIIPPLSVIFMLLSIIVIAVNYRNIPVAFGAIFKGAFEKKAFFGGLSGSALGIGLRRGMFSNEAGLGSSPVLHSGSAEKDPQKLGFMAAFEVFFDTIICCTLTALAFLCSGDSSSGITAAFSTAFGESSKYIVNLSLALFALATILGWSLCGEKCAEFIFGKSKISVFRAVFGVFVFLGAFCKSDSVWILSDIFNGLMAYPNLLGLFYLHKEVKCT